MDPGLHGIRDDGCVGLCEKPIPAFHPSPIIASSPDQMLCLLANRPKGPASLVLIRHCKMFEKVENSVWPPKLNEIRDSRASGRDVGSLCGV